MVQGSKTENLDGLNKLDFEKFEIILVNIQRSWEEKEYGGVVGGLVILADEIGKVSPELAQAMGLLIDSYGAAAKPFFDQLFVSGTKVEGYFVEQIAEAKKTLLPQFEKHEEAKANILAMKLRVLRAAGFTRREAIDIILAEMSKVGMSRNPLAESLSKASTFRKNS